MGLGYIDVMISGKSSPVAAAPSRSLHCKGLICALCFPDAVKLGVSQTVHTETQLEQIKNEISRDMKSALGIKLHKIIMYGSYARGDYNEDSDIDIMVLADIEERNMRIFRGLSNESASRISLEHNALVTISLK